MIPALLAAAVMTNVSLPSPWHVTQVSFCRLTVDLTGQADPHRYLLDSLPPQAIACPFAGKPRSAEVLIGQIGSSCVFPTPRVTMLQSSTLTEQKYDQQAQECLAPIKPWLPIGQRAAGDVHLLTIPDRNGVAFSRVTAGLWRVENRSGLPITRTFSASIDDKDIFCFEMAKGASRDLLGQLRGLDVELPRDASDQVNAAPNCTAALKGTLGPGERPGAGVTITIRTAAGAALSGTAFKRATLDALSQAHLPPGNNPDGSYVPLSADDPRPMVLSALADRMATVDVVKLSPPICGAIYDVMRRTQAFLSPLDDQASTIILRGTAGSEPPRYIALALQEVSSGKELCTALAPSFHRRLAMH